MIQPAYVTFEQSKWLKEKGFNPFTESTKSVATNNRYGKNEYYSFYQDARNWDVVGYESLKDKCVISFHEKVGTNSSEIDTLLVSYGVFNGNLGGIVSYVAPEQHQVVEWLRINHGIIVLALPDNEDDFIDTQKVIYTPVIYRVCEGLHNLYKELIRGKYTILYYNSPQEAYSAAFDYIRLNNLI
jgi:hypothetical protein